MIPGYTGFKPSVDSLKIRPYQELEKTTKHIPGYRGYIASVKAENVYATSFGRSSNYSLTGSITKGYDLSDSDRYYSTNNSTYVNQRNLTKELAETNPFLKPRRGVSILGAAGHKSLLPNLRITMSYAEARKAATQKGLEWLEI